HAIAARKIFRIAGAALRVRHHRAVLANFDSLHGAQKVGGLLLSDCAHDHIHINRKCAVGDCFRRSFSPLIGLAEARAQAFDSSHYAARAGDAHRLRLPQKIHTVLFGQLIFIAERRHFLLASPVDEVHRVRAQAARGRDHVDRGVSRADASHPPADGHFRKWQRLRGFDEFQRAAHSVQVLAGNIHGPGFSEADSNEDGVEIYFQLREAQALSDFHILAERNAQRFHHFHFPLGIGDARFVRRNPVGIQPAGKFPPVKYGHAVPFARKKRRAGQGRGAGPNAGHAPPIRLARLEELDLAVQHVVHRKPLQPANLDGPLAFFDHHARAFAKHFGGTNSPATFPKNIRLQNDPRRAPRVPRHNALDKAGHVDSRRTRLYAGSVKTIETSGGFDGRLARVHRRRDVRKILLVFFRRQFRRGLAKWHALTSSSDSALKHATRWTNFPTGRRVWNSS